MGHRYMSTNFVNEQEEENSPEISGESPQSSMHKDNNISSASPKKSKESIQKRVISVSIKDVEGSRSKNEMGAPPSDSWAWRKYGQKPIKGSPYPRAYYRCSSSKGCPARKQVERSRLDAKMLTVTYSCEHNHQWPGTRGSNKITSSNYTSPNNAIMATTNPEGNEDEEEFKEKPTNSSDKASVDAQTNTDKDKIGVNLGEGVLCNNSGLWFSDHFESTSSSMLECPIFTTEENMMIDSDLGMAFTMKEDDESFFADLGELPECSAVFCGKMMKREEEHRRDTLTTWCGTTT